MVVRTAIRPRTKLERALTRHGLTMADLARATGRTYMHVWTVVSGRARGGLQFYEDCARTLECPIGDLLGSLEEVA